MCDKKEVLLDCENCSNQYFCCRAVRVQLEDDEVGKFKCEPAIQNRKNINIVAHENGVCYYFDVRTRKCRVWDERPKVCREYDCRTDSRVKQVLARDPLPPLVRPDQTFKVFVSVASLDEQDKRKVSPMMVYSRHGPTSSDMIEIKGRGKFLVENAKKMVGRLIKEQLGEALNDEDDNV